MGAKATIVERAAPSPASGAKLTAGSYLADLYFIRILPTREAVTMKSTVFALLAIAALAAAPSLADDVRPDRVLDLVEEGTIRDLRELNRVALELHPGATIKDTELERDDGR